MLAAVALHGGHGACLTNESIDVSSFCGRYAGKQGEHLQREINPTAILVQNQVSEVSKKRSCKVFKDGIHQEKIDYNNIQTKN